MTQTKQEQQQHQKKHGKSKQMYYIEKRAHKIKKIKVLAQRNAYIKRNHEKQNKKTNNYIRF